MYIYIYIPLRCCLCGPFMHVDTCDVPSGRFCLGRPLSSKSGVQIVIGRTRGTRKHTLRVSNIMDTLTRMQNTCWVSDVAGGTPTGNRTHYFKSIKKTWYQPTGGSYIAQHFELVQKTLDDAQGGRTHTRATPC